MSNSQQLASALQSVNGGADNLILIKLRRGTYAPPAGSGGFSMSFNMNINGRIVEISGGWTGDGSSCTDKNLGAGGTWILGDTGGGALKLDLPVGSSNSTVSVSDLTFTAPNGGSSACLRGNVNSTNRLVIERTHFERCVAPSGNTGSIVLINSGGEIIVRNTVVRGGVGSLTGGVYVTSDGGLTRLNHVSITANRARQGLNPGGLFVNTMGPAQVHLTNSLVYGNTGLNGYNDIDSTGSGYFAVGYVHFGVLNGNAIQSNNRIGDPGLVAPGNPGLRADSSLINKALGNVSGGPGTFDVDGRPRVQDNLADIGAYEGAYTGDEIFRDILP
ncbi:hypothetical protein [Tahibacter harae]|uniref:Parallel beta helix pectate lyase-like protein n=1 Tax=Tahibacter harae TaxID=2963937 RepID=A0ABT1QRH4_9GAMM|nr:hypothetical protein [Tahibacter harae]MCQ4164884.1 hypothetical protein [Tahibacter harae]